MDDLLYASGWHLHTSRLQTSSGIPYVEEPDPSNGLLFHALQVSVLSFVALSYGAPY